MTESGAWSAESAGITESGLGALLLDNLDVRGNGAGSRFVPSEVELECVVDAEADLVIGSVVEAVDDAEGRRGAFTEG